MTAATITAICTGAAGVIGAVTALVVAIRHASNPNAHGGGKP